MQQTILVRHFQIHFASALTIIFINVTDRELETVDMGLSVIVIIVVIISLAYTVASMVFGGFVLVVNRFLKSLRCIENVLYKGQIKQTR